MLEISIILFRGIWGYSELNVIAIYSVIAIHIYISIITIVFSYWPN